MSYHYTDSGLDDVFLENGFTEHDTVYGAGVSIEDSAALHEAIGRRLIERPVSLDGAALRFLRLEMDLTQRDLAGIIGATEQTLRLWEKHRTKAVPGPADRLIRTLFSEALGDDRQVRAMLERLVEYDGTAQEEMRFRRTKRSWSLQPAMSLDPVVA